MQRQLRLGSTGLLPPWTAGLRLRRFIKCYKYFVFLYGPSIQVIKLLGEEGCELTMVWLGGNSLAELDHWVWPDGQKVSEDSAMWGRGEPGRGECMLLAESEWKTADCLDDTSVKAFLAHHRPAEVPTDPPLTEPSKRQTTDVPIETTDPGTPQTPS